jgi:glycosyltransferase involved in cell wall biosynthesis
VAPYIGGTQSAAVGVSLGYGLPAIITERIAAGIAEANIHGLQVVPAANTAALATAIDEFVKNPPNLTGSQPAHHDWGRMVETIEGIQSDLS